MKERVWRVKMHHLQLPGESPLTSIVTSSLFFPHQHTASLSFLSFLSSSFPHFEHVFIFASSRHTDDHTPAVPREVLDQPNSDVPSLPTPAPEEVPTSLSESVVEPPVAIGASLSNGHVVPAEAKPSVDSDPSLPSSLNTTSTSQPLAIESTEQILEPTAVPPIVELATSDIRHDAEVSLPQSGIKDETEQSTRATSDAQTLSAMKSPDTAPSTITAPAESNEPATQDLMDTSEDHKAPETKGDLPDRPATLAPEDSKMEDPLDPAPTPTQDTVTSSLPDATLSSQELPPPKAEEPSEPTINTSSLLQVDHEMQDAPTSPSKLTREREDEDMEDERAFKRTKTASEGRDGSAAPEFKKPEVPATTPAQPTQNGDVPLANGITVYSPEGDLGEMTPPRERYFVKSLQGIARSKNNGPFVNPVDPVLLNIPTYFDIIKHPMDLSTMIEKLRSHKYKTVVDYVADFNLIVGNCIKFNGLNHIVAVAAVNMKGTFDKQVNNMPQQDGSASATADKKKKKLSLPPAPKPAPRRESRASLPKAQSPPSATVASPQTFALKPEGVPHIRRESTTGDGRPKRDIHPPKNRDLPYSSGKPRKKKFATELKFCQETLNHLKSRPYAGMADPFLLPVDPVALNIPQYHNIIKKPMDLGTIQTALNNNQYENAKEFEADVRLVFSNCYKFNPPQDGVHQMGKSLEKVFNDKWSEKKRWVDQHTPGGDKSQVASPDPDDDEEEDEAEEEEEEEDTQLGFLQKQLEAMTKQIESIKKKSPPAAAKKGKTAKKADGGKKAKAAAAPAVKKEKKPVKEKRVPIVTYEQKRDISEMINNLPEQHMAKALRIIRENMPNLKVSVSFF